MSHLSQHGYGQGLSKSGQRGIHATHERPFSLNDPVASNTTQKFKSVAGPGTNPVRGKHASPCCLCPYLFLRQCDATAHHRLAKYACRWRAVRPGTAGPTHCVFEPSFCGFWPLEAGAREKTAALGRVPLLGGWAAGTNCPEPLPVSSSWRRLMVLPSGRPAPRAWCTAVDEFKVQR